MSPSKIRIASPSLGRRARAAAAVVLALVGTASGCARPETAADRHFAELDEAVRRMQADHDKIEAPLSSGSASGAAEGRARSGPREGRAGAGDASPPPRVVQLGGSSEDVEDATSDGGRPEIRLTGSPGVRSSRGKSRRGEDSEPLAVRMDGTSGSSALDPDAKKTYEAGLALVQGKQYDRGLEALTGFLVRFPDHPYAENATYWRGEAYYGQGEYLRAAEQFEGVLSKFGAGNKAPDALLKLGWCHERLGASERAHQYWEKLKTEFPKSEAAKRIPSAARDTSHKGPKESR